MEILPPFHMLRDLSLTSCVTIDCCKGNGARTYLATIYLLRIFHVRNVNMGFFVLWQFDPN